MFVTRIGKYRVGKNEAFNMYAIMGNDGITRYISGEKYLEHLCINGKLVEEKIDSYFNYGKRVEDAVK